MKKEEETDMKIKSTEHGEKEQLSYEEIVSEIESISEGMKKILSSRLNETAIVLLIQAACPSQGYGKPTPTKKTIQNILETASNLKEIYLKKLEESKK